MTPKEMRAERVKLHEQAQAINKKARDEKREFSGEEQGQWEKLNSELDRLAHQIERDEREMNLTDDFKRSPLDDTVSDGNPKPDLRGGNKETTKYTPGDAVRGWCLGNTAELTPEMRAAAAAYKINPDSKELRIKLPKKAARSVKEAEQRIAEVEQRALSVGTTTAGGFTVADDTSMYANIELSMLAFGGMRQVSTVLRTDTGGPLPIPTCNDTGNTGAILAENTTTTALDAVFAQLVLDAYKYSSRHILVSVELMQDSAINMDAFMGRILGERLGRITNTHFTTGTGSGQPNGVVTASGLGATGAASVGGLFSYVKLVELMHSVDPAYRQGGNVGWMMRDSSVSQARQLVDTTGRPMWEVSMQAGDPDRLLGYPVYINQDVAAVALSAKSVLFGNFSKYLIREVREIILLRLNERYADLHQVAFLAFMRTDGDLLDAGTDPVKHFIGNAA